jgi:glucokinase
VGSYSIGVDLGGTNLRIAAYSPEDGLKDTIQLATRRREGRDTVLFDLRNAVESLAAGLGGIERCLGICVATPGPMELPEGLLLNPPNLPGWENFQLRRELERCLNRLVIVENDANVAALAECLLGQGSEFKVESLCMLTLGTGVGSGIILNGQIWHGMNGMAGESGHVSVDPDGPFCACGTRGCLELSASATGLIRMARERALLRPDSGPADLIRANADFTALQLFDLAKNGDNDSIRIFETLGEALGRGLSSLVNSLNLPLYVIGGGVASAWEMFAPRMFEVLAQGSSLYRLTDPKRQLGDRMAKADTHVVPARLGSNSGILGACLMPFRVDVSTGRLSGVAANNQDVPR